MSCVRRLVSFYRCLGRLEPSDTLPYDVVCKGMNHIRTALLLSASALAVSMNAYGQMRMQQQPMQHIDSFPRETSLTEDQWIRSIIDHWSGSQRRSWLSLDRNFSGWVSHLVWTRQNARQSSLDPDAKRTLFQIPAGCPVETFVAPTQSVADSMSYFQSALPEINWDAWNNIEPKFRGVAEWELSVLHTRAQRLAAQRTWWERNDKQVRECLDSTPNPNPRYEQIDRREKLEREAVDREHAPEPIRQAARQQISDAAAVDKYLAALGGFKQ
jgi:hypothetical protein